ncbi:MAG: DUF402 domain-containing protein [Longimicrobiales bacterium]|nr:DUF402 domain-containing protein [Longimicrobiales bacterium]
MSIWVDIHYRRPPDDVQIFIQQLVLDRKDVRVTLARDMDFESPVLVHDEVVLEPGSDVVWFTFPGRWHDIGRFHRSDDTFTGIYANILTPPVFTEDESRPREIWRTTDLFLDVWLPEEGGLFVLDRDQLDEAVEKEWVSSERARRALEEVEWIEEAHAQGRWPPPVVEEWTLERTRRRAGG